MVTNCQRIFFHAYSGELGSLSAIEGDRDVPFDIRRVYYITKVPENATRGFHSHRKLEQVLLCLNGSVKIRIKTPYEEEIVLLDNPNEGLYIGHMVWREMFNFTPDAVLMVLASEYYEEADYIRDEQQYIEEAIPYFIGGRKNNENPF